VSVRVLVVGDAMVDVVVRSLAPLAPTSDTPARIGLGRGGAAANLAVALAAAGPHLEVDYAAAVGHDAAGALFTRELEQSGVRPRLRVCAGSTGVVVALVGDDGERAMLTDRGVNGELDLDHLRTCLDEGVAHLHVSGYVALEPTTRALVSPLFELARSRGVSTSVDVCSVAPLRRMGVEDFAEVVAGAQTLFANEEEALELAGRAELNLALETLARRWDEVVVTRGAHGVLMRRHEQVWAAPALAVAAVDTTGAGDCATGTYLARRLAGDSVEDCLARAMQAAAQVVTGLGSRGQSRL
jgi:sugar/nucleoside kinase (ribokinase family)